MADPKRLTEAMRAKNLMTLLLAHEGWIVLSKIINAQIHTRRQEYELAPLESLDALPKQEYMKGEVASLSMVLNLPQAIIDGEQPVIDAAREEEQEKNGEEASLDEE